MGFFQSLFNKERGHHVKKEVITPKDTHITTAKTPAPPMNHSTVVTTETIPDQPSTISRRSSRHSISSHHILPATSPTVPLSPQQSNSTSTHPSNSPPLSQRASSEAVRRFQLVEDGTHMHHLTQPAQNRIAASLNGLVTGIANKSLRLTQWTERKVSLDEIMKERAALDVRLHREASERTLAEKWGTCQETIGKGTSGVVRVAHKMDGTGERLYAVKELRKRAQETSKDYVNRLTSEYYISSTMHHINVIQTFDILPQNEVSPIFCQIMEYSGGGDLFDVLYDSPDGLEVAEANCFFKQLIRGVTYLHNIGVAHRDLKPENLLLTTYGCLKISDFGSAACFKGATVDSDGEEDDDEEACSKIHLIKGLVGSEPYIAPEEFIEQNYDARQVDVWSCGIIYMAMRKATHLWQVAKSGEDEAYDKYLKFRQLLDEERENARREHCQRKNLEKTLTEEERIQEKAKREAGVLKARETIRKRAKEGRFDTLEGIDIQAKKVVYRMLDPNPKKRITSNEVLETEWVRKVYCCQPEELPSSLTS
ncbi:Ser/Thr protein kinase [Mucor ambiguus]|uniref:non-specific serine/threonine protein kinase n=1 Tax=Mucor ambiguus TaxID=91626 RepID=A0A0C9MVP1_9FUNG|nr:Ser/Thr protein kinase [Mucor ambiguus]